MKVYKNSYIFIIIIIVSFCYFSLNAQNTKPFKTGLVLSGGGAKGLAHIGLLQIIDSLDIQVDYLTGTSMGAIVGALYASGYSGDSISSIISRIDWDYILSNRIPLNKVHIIEKESYGKSMAALPFHKGIPMLPNALIEGQFIIDEMNRILFHTRNTNDFSELPIPLKVIASDIITGKTVELSNGNIPLSIRASMAIPGVFTPVHLDDYLLVDGGTNRNFPVEEVREMGADMVIGSYTGMRIRSRKEVKNPINTISQVFAFGAVADAEKQKSLCDIVLDFSNSLSQFQAQSFFDYQKIINIGKQEAYKILPQLIELKKRQDEAGIRKQMQELADDTIPIRQINTYTQELEPLSKGQYATFKTILDSKNLQKLDNYEYLQEKISNIYSLDFYSKIYYTFSNNNDTTKDLNIFVKPVNRKLKVSLHFDTYESAGIILKFNQNNLWLNNSKFTFGADLSAFPKIRVSYLKFLNNKLNVWGQLSYDMRLEVYNDIYFKVISQAMFNTKSTLKKTNQQINLSVGYAPTMNSSLTLNAIYEYDKINKDKGIFSSLIFIEDVISHYSHMYKHNQSVLELRYNLNTLNASYYPTSGLQLSAKIGWIHNIKYHFDIPPVYDEIGRAFYEILDPKVNKREVYDNVFRASFEAHWVVPINTKISIQNYLFTGMNFVNKNNTLTLASDYDYLFVSQMYSIGGYNNYDYNSQVPFAGFGVNELYNNSVISLTAAFQWNIWKKFYLTPRVSAGQVITYKNPFSKNNFEDWLLGVGIDADYLTPLGPIKVGFGINNQVGVFIGLLSLGYQF